MIINMTGGGGGGAALNFDVKAYATEEALLAATPKENTIGIITTNKITGWLFSATEPENPSEGMVWISTGTASTTEFNALKKNGIQVYPLSAKQYISGAWVDVTAMSYQGGEWHGWLPSNRLFWLGDYRNEITGGWAVSKMGNNSVGTMLKGDTTIGVSHSTSNSYCHTALYCNNKIDFTNIDTVYINVLDYTGNMDLRFLVKSGLEGSVLLEKALFVGENAIDVRSISGTYLFILRTYTASKNGSYNVDKIWME